MLNGGNNIISNAKEEIWKPVKGYEGFYEVSNLGRIRSLDRTVNCVHNSVAIKKGKILKLSTIPKGYLCAHFSKYGKSKSIEIQRVVALAFIPNPNNLPCVNHKDEDKTNNKVDNLEWCTYKYNNTYGTRLEKSAKKHINGKNAKTVYQYSLDEKFLNEYPSCAELKRLYNYDASKISECCRGLRKTAYGYKWKYIKEE